MNTNKTIWGNFNKEILNQEINDDSKENVDNDSNVSEQKIEYSQEQLLYFEIKAKNKLRPIASINSKCSANI